MATVCFNCGKPASAQIANTRPPVHAKRVCNEKKCWDAWYEKFSHK